MAWYYGVLFFSFCFAHLFLHFLFSLLILITKAAEAFRWDLFFAMFCFVLQSILFFQLLYLYWRPGHLIFFFFCLFGCRVCTMNFGPTFRIILLSWANVKLFCFQRAPTRVIFSPALLLLPQLTICRSNGESPGSNLVL